MLVEWEGKAYGTNRRLEKGKYGNIYKNPAYIGFQTGLTWQLVEARVRNGGGIKGEVQVRFDFTIDPLRDIDSLIKPALDCLQVAEVIENDRYVMRLLATKQKKGRGKPDVIRVSIDKI